MKVYTTDEIAFEISELDIPDQLAATGPKWGVNQGQLLDDTHLVGAVEGWIACLLTERARNDHESYINALKDIGIEPNPHLKAEPEGVDDAEYPAKRVIHREPDGTIVMNARFGRDKRWVMAFNRESNEKAKAAIEAWIGLETGEEQVP